MEVHRKFFITLVLLSNFTHAQYPASSGIHELSDEHVTQYIGEENSYYTGHSVSYVDDINGDSIDDLLLGSNGNNNVYGSYVIFGSGNSSHNTLVLEDLNGANGFKIQSSESGDFLGFSINALGDFNQDGFNDIIIGAFKSAINGVESGRAYVVFGTDQGFLPVVDLSSLNGSNGFVINGEAAGDKLGFSVAAAGDVNNDGFDDAIVGAYFANNQGDDSGSVYVLLGTGVEYTDGFDLINLNGSNGFRVDGEYAGDHFGGSVSAAGDVNNDGIDDLMVGAILNDNNGDRSGATYIVFGTQTFQPVVNAGDLNGMNGFVIVGDKPLARIGYKVLDAGDFNQDGFDDIMIGSPSSTSDARRGVVYVVFGQKSYANNTYKIDYSDGLSGVLFRGVLNESTLFGTSFTRGFDINGDGYQDFAIGAPFQDIENSDSNGVLYVIYGSAELANLAQIDVEKLDGKNGFSLHGQFGGDELGISVHAAGDIDQDGLDDLIIGARGWSNDNHGAAYLLSGNDTIFSNGF